MLKKRKELKRLLKKRGIVVAPGVYDAMGAKLVENLRFDAAYLTGFGCSASLLGQPDLGLITLTELVAQAKNINNVTAIPLIADCESGFGNALNTARAIREYENAGVAALHIEDQAIPKRYKPDGKPQIVSMEEHVNKIKAAAEARTDKNLLIIGRTEALGRYGLKEAVKRGNAYFEAGCDMVFVHGPQTVDELKVIAKEIFAPQIVNYSTIIESGNEPILSVSELEDLGFKLVIFPTILLLTGALAMKSALLEFGKTGKFSRYLEEMISIAEFRKIMDWDTFTEREEKFLPKLK